MSIVAKRCGVKFDPPSIIIVYENKNTSRMRKRIIPVRNFSQYSDCSRAAERLKYHVRHSVYVESVSLAQLERLHLILRDHLRGLSLEESLAAQQGPGPSDEDLNKLSDEELNRRKAQMDQLFERNRRHKDDADFVYDLEVEFPENSVREECSWDDHSDDEF
ncbi:centrosomal protein of 19 kDa [Misgurnus anguillicaudatus]|uniref:centrosomal protein of 19 kDa n=1 Tax=Misgurnus anguillicaudatus TaxID=75329 RepID=UPI002435E80B|nr:centrosomal protein of 19 kDa [Misgurnus anguillicaudatus]XP_055074507.1 centrosomal protein of 19 kDa [Misgurnus anguillicaudatus]XP_055074509.1 centrosomal protein of 19 kDa [Misgurnus anguillicaudatus]XP_055074510.1 centrosomal protein of 19 kDa [Misgurnus anguillicaudatus]XP_055074511.1 centrosomal protein of 19 kDa [Misgurnus anguillicaudatus]